MWTTNSNPFHHAVYDGLFNLDLVHEASQDWPADNWSGWTIYDTLLERKRTCSNWEQMPLSCAGLLAQLMIQKWIENFLRSEAVPDTLLWGTGLHSMANGEHLDIHLDHDRHPKTKMHRKATGILFLEDWPHSWGGKLQLWSHRMDEPEATVIPAAGRLAVFENSDFAYHGVSPLTCPAEVRRKTITMAWYGVCHDECKRPRAKFFPHAGESANPAKDALRKQRCN